MIFHAHAERRQTGRVNLSMSYAEAVAIREAIAFADFTGDLPSRGPGADRALSSLLVSLDGGHDGLIPELGSEA